KWIATSAVPSASHTRSCVCAHRLICLVPFVFFFQAEDGIRDRNVTGVQTCALPISLLKKTLNLKRPSDLAGRRSVLKILTDCSWNWYPMSRRPSCPVGTQTIFLLNTVFGDSGEPRSD